MGCPYYRRNVKMGLKMNIDLDTASEKVVSIKVVGVGGGGGNAVNRMCSVGMSSAELVSLNTDIQALRSSGATYKLHIGDKVTKGMGAGGNPEIGEKAAEESQEEIKTLLKGTEMLFITAGMGGGTGTGAAPVVGRIAKEMGILTVGVVTKPFNFEGKVRMKQAEEGIERLKSNVDALLVIPNERLRHISEEPITLFNAFAAADDVLMQAVQSISDLINIRGVVNLDFADVCSIMTGAGFTHMGVGRASGPDKAEKAVKQAITSPLLETSITGAQGVIVNFLTSPNIDLEDLNTASTLISDAAHENVRLIWGVAFDESMEDDLRVTIIATNFDNGCGVPLYESPREVEANRRQEKEQAAKAAASQAQPQPAPRKEEPAERSIHDIISDTSKDFDDIDLTDILKMLNNR